MAIPFKYNLRNLFRRRLRTGLTVTGIALVIAAVVIMFAFSRGLLSSIRNNGEPDNIIIISKKAADRVFSSIKKGAFDRMTGILMDRLAQGKDRDGLEIELASPYIHHTARLKDSDSEAIVMGVDTEKAHLMHRKFTLIEGQSLMEAVEEDINQGKVALVGALAYARLGLSKEKLAVGETLVFNDAKWRIVGVFSIPGTSMDNEIWVPLDELASHLHRTDYSFGIIRVKDPSDIDGVVQEIGDNEQLPFTAIPEKTFFAGHADNFNIFIYISIFMAVITTLGGLTAGMNTMYTSIQGRIREFGTLQVLGFSRGAIIKALLLESVMIALAGGAIGCLFGSLVNGLPVQVTMGAFLFKVDGMVVLPAMLLALAIGIIGAIVPAWRALKMRMVDAMRFN